MSNASNVLLVYVHPEPRQSIANKALLRAVRIWKNITIHDLYATYPDFLSIFTVSKHYCVNIKSLYFSFHYKLIVVLRY